MTTNPNLMSIPIEIRFIIWHIYYTQVARPKVHFNNNLAEDTETFGEVDDALALTCKQIRAEAWPVLWANAEMHIVYQSFAPCMLPGPHLPQVLRDHVQNIWFHCPAHGQYDDHERPPKWPIKFHEFPKLATLTVCTPIAINMTRLMTVGDKVITEPAYTALSLEERLALWRRPGVLSGSEIINDLTAFGRGGWLSRLLDPQTFSEPILLEADDDDEFDDPDWERWSRDYSWRSSRSDNGLVCHVTEEELRVMAKEDNPRFQAAIKRMHIIVEAQLCIYLESDINLYYAPRTFESLLAVVDPKTKEITELKRLEPDDLEKLRVWGAEVPEGI
jgi:hypothetical protein